jgi:transposase
MKGNRPVKKHITYIGMDCSDRTSVCHVTDSRGLMLDEFKMANRMADLLKALSPWPGARVALESGTHSGWMTRALREAGYTVVVADARQLPLIYQNVRKSDRNDARALARLLRLEPALLGSVHVRSQQSQADLSLLKARDALVRVRTVLINSVRGLFKSLGHRAPAASAEAFAAKTLVELPEILAPAVEPLLTQISALTQSIRTYDKQVNALCAKRYPQTELLMSVTGVGPITALTFALVIDEPRRFSKSRDVGAYLGLSSRRDQSGVRDPDLPITKAGNALLRRLLVQAAQYNLGPFAKDSRLRDWGLAKAGDSKRNKRKIIIAVARKLAVLLHSLWVNGAYYEAYPQTKTALEDAA